MASTDAKTRHEKTARDGRRQARLTRSRTHEPPGPRNFFIDLYTDAEGIWPALCEAVLCLKVRSPSEDNLVQLPVAVGMGTATDTDWRSTFVS